VLGVLVLVFALPVAFHVGYGLVYWAYSASPDGHFPFSSDFENGDLGEWSWIGAKQLCCDHSAEVVESPVRSGRYALKVTLRKDDPPVKNSLRAELRMKSARFGTDFWYEFSVYVPPDWRPISDKVTFAQWHATPDRLLGEKSRPPPLSFEIVGDEFHLKGDWDSSLISTSWFHRSSNIGKTVLWSSPLVSGRWIDWAVRVRWSYEEDGILELWKDGEMVFQRSGPNTFNDILAPYFKIGVYNSDWKSRSSDALNRTEKRTLYFDAIHVLEGCSEADPCQETPPPKGRDR